MSLTKSMEGANDSAGCAVILGPMCIVLSLLALYAGRTEGEPLLLCMGVAFFFAGLLLLVGGARMLYIRSLVGKPKIEISSSLLGVGERFTVSYFHIFKKPLNVKAIHLELIFRETATYKQGTATKTVDHDEVVTEIEDPGGKFEAKSVIEKSHEFQIPPNGMHSLVVTDNKLQWFIRFRLELLDLSDYVDKYEVQVLPEMR